LLERGGYRKPIVRMLCQVLLQHSPARTTGRPETVSQPKFPDAESQQLYQAVLQGINLERPFQEHGRPFPVIPAIGAEEALWLLTCLAQPGEVPEEIIVPYLTSAYHRERIDAAVLLALQGFRSPNPDPNGAEAVLLREASKAYPFPEIWSIGKGMPDDNFRDKAYMVQALAMHTANLGALERFADPGWAYRDLRYALARGLARRGKTDAIPLLLRLCQDPLTVVQQQARYALADIRDQARLRGELVPHFRVAWQTDTQSAQAHKPTAPEATTIWVPVNDSSWTRRHYPPKAYSWPNPKPAPLPPRLSLAQPLSDWQKLLLPQHFRNLSIPFVRGADRMMVQHAHELASIAEALRQVPPQQSREVWLRWLDSPYPYAQYLALESLAQQPQPQLTPLLLQQLDDFAQRGNAVGFWWCCEALSAVAKQLPDLSSNDSASRAQLLQALAKYAGPSPTSSPFFGPEGMALGYPATRAIGRIAASTSHEFVRQLWQSDNLWLRAGVLRGLAEAGAANLDAWLEEAKQPGQPALVRAEAEIQLYRRKQQSLPAR